MYYGNPQNFPQIPQNFCNWTVQHGVYVCKPRYTYAKGQRQLMRNPKIHPKEWIARGLAGPGPTGGVGVHQVPTLRQQKKARRQAAQYRAMNPQQFSGGVQQQGSCASGMFWSGGICHPIFYPETACPAWQVVCGSPELDDPPICCDPSNIPPGYHVLQQQPSRRRGFTTQQFQPPPPHPASRFKNPMSPFQPTLSAPMPGVSMSGAPRMFRNPMTPKQRRQALKAARHRALLGGFNTRDLIAPLQHQAAGPCPPGQVVCGSPQTPGEAPPCCPSGGGGTVWGHDAIISDGLICPGPSKAGQMIPCGVF